MKKLLLFMFVALLAAAPARAAIKTITLTASSFGLEGSYAFKTATVGGFDFSVNQGFLQQNTTNIQMNSGKGLGVLYNTTAISGLKTITVNVASGSKPYTVTTGTVVSPTTNSISNNTSTQTFYAQTGDTYFQLKVTNGACYFSSIVITYDDGTTIETVATPTFTPAAGTYTSAQNVTIACATSGATIHYTTDGSTPTASSATYSDAIAVSSTTTIKAIAVKSGMNNSAVASAIYTINSGSGSTTEGKYVLVTDVSTLTAGDKVLIANSGTAGSAKAISTAVYNSSGDYYRPETAVTIVDNSGTMTIDPGSEVEIYNLGGTSGAWTFQATGSNYSGQYLACASGDYNNAIYISTLADNGRATVSTTSAGTATIAFNSGSRNLLKYNTQYNNFACYASTYTTNVSDVYIYRYEESGGGTTETVATPTFSPAAGTYTSAQNVTIACATSGATIHYTTDGSTPTTSNATYSSAIAVSATTTIKAIAVKSGMNDSEVASATYTIGGSTPTPTGDFELLTDASTLTAGDQIIITNGCTAGTAKAIDANPRYNDNGSEALNRLATDVTIATTTGGTTIVTPSSTTEIYNLVGSSGAWSLQATGSYYSDKYLCNGTSNRALIYEQTITGHSTVSISVDANHAATIQFSETDNTSNHNNLIRYNSSNNIFNTYASGQDDIYIFRRAVTSSESELTVVEGIADFKQVTPGTVVRLYLPDANDARVLHVESSGTTTNAYVRDNTGTILMAGISPNRPLATNQHLAGWINGTYSLSSTGVPQFVPDNGLTNTAFLVIADPVTEEAVAPTPVASNEVDDFVADWVKVSNVRMGDSNLDISNAFNIAGYVAPYEGALVDLSAIVGATGTLYPVSENGVPMVTHVVDPSQPFTPPASDLEGAAVRWNRVLQAGMWTAVTVPFDIAGEDFEGTIMQYSSLTEGEPIYGPKSGRWFDAGNMVFTQVDRISAGVPALVKPDESYSSLTLTGTTLSATAAQTVSRTLGSAQSAPARRALSNSDTYSLVGTYSPTTVPTDMTAKVLTSEGNVVWVDATNNTVAGTGAYLTTPAGQGVHLVLGEDVITGVSVIAAPQATARSGIFNLLGMKMNVPWEDLPAGLYIVNGVKTIKR